MFLAYMTTYPYVHFLINDFFQEQIPHLNAHKTKICDHSFICNCIIHNYNFFSWAQKMETQGGSQDI